MEEAFKPDSLALLAPNLSSGAQQAGGHPNLSVVPSRWALPGQPARTTTAAAILLLALVGNGLLLRRLRCGGCGCCQGRFGRRRKLDFLLAHLAVADLYGCGLALFSQLPPADAEPEPGLAGEWPAAREATCRLLRLLQGSGLLAPSHMLVLIALERHSLVSGPRGPVYMPSRGALAALGWLLALLLALPQAFVFQLAPPQTGGRCLSIFPQLPRWHGRAYAVYGAVTGFVAPACLLGGTCGRILWASRAKEDGDEEQPQPTREPSRGSRCGPGELPGAASPPAPPPPPPTPPPPLLLRLLPVARCASPSSPAPPRSLPRARARALQLTLALATLFALCGFPRCLLELGLAFAASPESPDDGDDGTPAALGSLLAATNTALNPYLCLLFHSHRPWARRLQRRLCRCPDRPQPRRRARPRRRPPPPPPPLALERPGRWLCPCQTKPPPAPAAPRALEPLCQSGP